MSFDIAVKVPVVYDDVHRGIEGAAAAGADAIEFFDWENVNLDRIRNKAADHGIFITGIVAAGAGRSMNDPDAPSMNNPADHQQAVADIERSIEAAAVLEADTLTVNVGQRIGTLSKATQQNAIVDVLREVAPSAESHEVTIVVEPLNTRVEHPGYFLKTSDMGFEIVNAVNSPRVKLLFDIYHQQITEGYITPTLVDQLEDIGLIHVADVPGRHELGTGELDYEYILTTLNEAGYDDVISCEFHPNGDPDSAVTHVVSLAERIS